MARKITIGTTTDIAKKWSDITPGRAGYYEAGVTGAGPDWEANTINAKANYKLAVSAADIDKRFAGGVKKAGGTKYERKATTLGKDRFGPGVIAAVDDFNTGFSPFRDTLDGMDIPDRKPRGDKSNYAIVEKVGDALFKKRMALIGASS